MQNWPAKTSLAILGFAATMAVLRCIPAFEQFPSLGFSTVASILEFNGQNAAVHAPGANGAYVHLIDRSHALDPFYRALAKADGRDPGAVVQILHFGDSPVTADQISGEVRSLLQERFGNAGEGFILISKPWPWYSHRHVGMSGHGWTTEAASQNYSRDGLHGLGGATFQGSAGALAEFDLPSAHRRMEVLYWAQPGGGGIEIWSGSDKLSGVSTEDSIRKSGFLTVELPPSARHIQLRVTSGAVRLFGVSFETDGPGVRYHSLGLNAARIETPLRHFDARHWAEQIQHQLPDLVVINYGTNESGYPGYIDGPYAADLRELVRRIQDAAPAASILIMSPMDRGVRDAHGGIVTMAKLPKVVEIQRSVAAELGCAFFNTFQAMGGEGTMGRWYEERPRLASADFTHPLPAGAKRVGALFENALYQGYLNYKAGAAPKAVASYRH
jgi:lysophospholipase L1-like esterase